MKFEDLAIVPVGSALDSQIEALLPVLSKKLQINPTLLPPLADVDEAFNSKRNQYHSTRIIAILEGEENLRQYSKIAGVTSLDLYNPGMDGQGFVIGEARCPGRSCIVSSARLRSSNKTNELEVRIRKEVLHEIGHMKGLRHCPKLKCVMSRSINVINIDTKGDDFCNECRHELGFQL